MQVLNLGWWSLRNLDNNNIYYPCSSMKKPSKYWKPLEGQEWPGSSLEKRAAKFYSQNTLTALTV